MKAHMEGTVAAAMYVAAAVGIEDEEAKRLVVRWCGTTLNWLCRRVGRVPLCYRFAQARAAHKLCAIEIEETGLVQAVADRRRLLDARDLAGPREHSHTVAVAPVIPPPDLL